VRVVFPFIFEVMRPEDIYEKKILIAPLNWGMGHVSRCIGLIHQLIQQNNSIVVACNPDQQMVFEVYFDNLVYVPLEGYPFKFSGKGNFGWDLLKNWSKLKGRLKREKVETAALVRDLKIDIVISDHRYGFFAKSVPSIFLTHQYNLPVSGIQSISDVWHKKRMRPFRYLWILDDSSSRLAGKLSSTSSEKRAIHIGPYSRFSIYDRVVDKTVEKVVVVSGPMIYAQQLADEMAKEHSDAVFVCSSQIELPKHLKRISGSWKEIDEVMLRAKHIISRSGYSTIMDVDYLGVSATFYPTPGQAEQIYLNEWLTDNSEYTPSTHRGHS